MYEGRILFFTWLLLTTLVPTPIRSASDETPPEHSGRDAQNGNQNFTTSNLSPEDRVPRHNDPNNIENQENQAANGNVPPEINQTNEMQVCEPEGSRIRDRTAAKMESGSSEASLPEPPKKKRKKSKMTKQQRVKKWGKNKQYKVNSFPLSIITQKTEKRTKYSAFFLFFFSPGRVGVIKLRLRTVNKTTSQRE